MPALANTSDERLLIKEKRTNKLKYRLMVTIVSHFAWGVIHIVFELTDKGRLYPHTFITVIGGIGHYAGELSRADIYLLKLRQEIEHRHLVRRRFTVRDCLEVLTTGMSVGLVIGGAAEVLDLVLHGSGAK